MIKRGPIAEIEISAGDFFLAIKNPSSAEEINNGRGSKLNKRRIERFSSLRITGNNHWPRK
jgi:ribosomal protein L9